MTTYFLNIIPGTAKYVELELLAKFPATIVKEITRDKIYFESTIDELDKFRILFSALHITKENGSTRNLFRRDWKEVSVPAGINPALAYILCMIADVQTTDIIFDPFCGAGTIAITAAKYFNPAKVFAADLSGKAIDFTLQNLKASGVNKKNFIAFRSNVSQLKLQKDSVTKIITNLPFGIRVGDHEQNIKAYEMLAAKAEIAVQSGGKLVLYTQEKKLLVESFNNTSFKYQEEIEVEQGGLIPSIFVYKKL